MATVMKRTIKRSRVLLHGIVSASVGDQKIRIRDVSSAGALLEPMDPSFIPTVEEKIILVCGESRVDGRVAWVDGSWFGVEFLAPLKTGSLVDAAGSRLKVSTPRSQRYHQLSDLDEEQETAFRIEPPSTLN